MTADPVMSEIQDAISLMQGGNRIDARTALEAIWQKIERERAPLHECVLSHFMADLQETLESELSWDLRAFEAATRCEPGVADIFAQGISLHQFMPSLHLNLADDYFRLDQPAIAQSHVESASKPPIEAPSFPYFDMIRGGVRRLEAKLAEKQAVQ
jgi:hypothetical protein